MFARRHSWAMATSKHLNMHTETPIRVAVAKGLRTSLVLFRGLHALPAHDLTQAGLIDSQAPKVSPPTSANSKMGNLFSKEKRHGSHNNDYAPIPAPAVDSGRYTQHPSYSHKIDPRDQRHQQYQQPQQYSQQVQPKTAPRKILAEYYLDVTCSYCKQQQDCKFIPDLSANVLTRRNAYRDPSNAGGERPWTLSIDCCSDFVEQRKCGDAADVLKRFCGGQDRAYADVGPGSTHVANGSHRFFGREKAAAEEEAALEEPFEVDALLQALRVKGVKFTSSV
ncbi:hypothetical protein B0I37DRAFT_194470 [Chaetomium sp. MPI-CAGE-AT-0009]|nr:hypothetical protein B0I37DRAFT_194470 [Chaetomium sp. MPI-CAGE-AT-0009]